MGHFYSRFPFQRLPGQARGDSGDPDRCRHQPEGDADAADVIRRDQQQGTQLQHHRAGQELEQTAFAFREFPCAEAEGEDRDDQRQRQDVDQIISGEIAVARGGCEVGQGEQARIDHGEARRAQQLVEVRGDGQEYRGGEHGR